MKYTFIIAMIMMMCSASFLSASQSTDPPGINTEVNFYFPKNVYHFLIAENIQEYYSDLKVYLDANQDKQIELTGFADDGKNPAWNERVSKYRARKVRDSLVKAGISKDRIKIDYKGKEMPIAQDDSPEELAKNRRVELRVL